MLPIFHTLLKNCRVPLKKVSAQTPWVSENAFRALATDTYPGTEINQLKIVFVSIKKSSNSPSYTELVRSLFGDKLRMSEKKETILVCFFSIKKCGLIIWTKIFLQDFICLFDCTKSFFSSIEKTKTNEWEVTVLEHSIQMLCSNVFFLGFVFIFSTSSDESLHCHHLEQFVVDFSSSLCRQFKSISDWCPTISHS